MSYEFLVSNRGYWQFMRWTNGTRSTPFEDRDNYSNSIKQGSEWNHLKITAEGDAIAVYINGTRVARLPGAQLTCGSMGLSRGSGSVGGVTMSFDDLAVWPPEL